MGQTGPVLSALGAGAGSRPTGPLPPFVAFLNSLLCPGVAALSLLACTYAYGETFSGYYVVLAVLAFLIASQVFDDIDLFLPWRIMELARITRTVLVAWAVVIGVVLFLGYATQLTGEFSYEVIVTWFAVTPLALLASIRVARRVVRRVVATRTRALARTAVIVGANNLGRMFATRVSKDPYLGISLAGFFDDRAEERIGLFGGDLLGTVEDVPDYVRRKGIHCVYIALPIAAQPRLLRLIKELRDTTASIYFLPDFFMFDLVAARFDYVTGIPVVAICETPFYGVNAVLKRAMDLLLGTLFLVLLAPVMLAIAIAIRLDSPGPALFRQRRYGMDGSEIVVFKFRTMKVAEDGASVRQAQRNDPRITRLGAFLRRTSLDELPQFFNVVAGTMSIVGPRPHAVAHNEQYRKLIPGYMLRHKVNPGITGWAQVNGFRGETETLEKMKRRVDLDLDYLNNWSPSLDLWIMVKTVGCIWKDGNAY
jgi:putative colanic acid biosynthesis UDP-glucose lipid carrier transferase